MPKRTSKEKPLPDLHNHADALHKGLDHLEGKVDHGELEGIKREVEAIKAWIAKHLSKK